MEFQVYIWDGILRDSLLLNAISDTQYISKCVQSGEESPADLVRIDSFVTLPLPFPFPYARADW